jgi:shikimate kinase
LKTNNPGEIPDCRIILVGAMGVGKSTVGKLLAEILDWEYIDNDFEISKLASLSIKQLSQLDVPTLHALESDYLRDILNRPTPLIAAASIADNLNLINALGNEFTVYLHSPLENLMKNAGTTGVGRQGLVENPSEVIRERFERRDPRYRSVASLLIDISVGPESAAKLIVEKLKA